MAHLDEVGRERQMIGPTRTGDQVCFRPVARAAAIEWGYASTTTPPSKVIFRPREEIVRFTREDGRYRSESVEPSPEPAVLVGVHPCDLHGILVMDRTLMGETRDPWYGARRSATLVIGLNCQSVGPECFCRSLGTGPFYHTWMGQGPPDGCDVLLTDLGGDFLAELLSHEGEALLSGIEGRPVTQQDVDRKAEAEARTAERFSKALVTQGLPEILADTLDHPVWEQVGEARCLSCTNCTMVCPTCYCYDVEEEADLDLGTIRRFRQWDSCQDQHFAEVHFGNFRSTRASRLRQFVCHKLCYWVEQYGCFGCVGCGRCIRWCPTAIDLTQIAADIRREVSLR
jgi:ferredoxin